MNATGYGYELLKYNETASKYEHVGEAANFDTLDELRQAVKTDLGYVPGWLMYVSPSTYLQEESDEDGGYTVVIEGCEEMPPTAA